MQQLTEEITTYRRDADMCRKANVDVIGLESKRPLNEMAVLLTSLADEKSGLNEVLWRRGRN